MECSLEEGCLPPCWECGMTLWSLQLPPCHSLGMFYPAQMRLVLSLLGLFFSLLFFSSCLTSTHPSDVTYGNTSSGKPSPNPPLLNEIKNSNRVLPVSFVSLLFYFILFISPITFPGDRLLNSLSPSLEENHCEVRESVRGCHHFTVIVQPNVDQYHVLSKDQSACG